jgi:uncharacterized protein (TIGR00299 family) protein
MKTAYLDLAGGLSGDIFVALFLDAGVSAADLTAVLKALPLGRWTLEEETVQAFGLRARRVKFRTDPCPPHRHWADIRDRIIAPAALPEPVKAMALAAFEALAQAEAQAHGLDPDHVHFHEVGADDSILDLVGAAACLHLAGVAELTASPVPLCRGVGQAGHGLLPLPGPATVALLTGKPVFGSGETQENVTPTGAAILTWASGFGDLPPLTLERVGTAVGTRPPTRGLTRLFLGRRLEVIPLDLGRSEEVAVLTTFVDDMSPELLGGLLDRLLAAGALDVALSSLQMKKSRPGIRLEVLASPAQAQALAGLVLEESATLGLRVMVERRHCLERRAGTVTVEGREVAGKWTKRPSGRWEFKPEHDAVQALAAELGRPAGLIHRLALAQALTQGGPG